MKSKPMVFPLDTHGTVYVLEDEQGKSLGTGSRARRVATLRSGT